MNKKILILGAHGMLGGAMVHEFREHGYNVVSADRSDFDITNEEASRAFFDTTMPDIVLNTAAYNAVDDIGESEEAYERAMMINGAAPGQLTELCSRRNIIFVHYSSDYIFPGTKEAGYTEDEFVGTHVNKYGETKRLGEEQVQSHGEKYYMIRLSRLFGIPGVSEGSKKSFVDTIRWLATEGGKTELTVVDEEVSCPTYAPDIASFTRRIIEEEKPYGIYHGANDGACTWYEFAKEIFHILNLSVKVTPVSGNAYTRPAKRPSFSMLRNTKMPLQRGWQEALREYLLGTV
ncbi:MAG: dTDP-4-dehydrorhamnose reductase [Candidatus Magasanikbacteria bacterium CG11_big_fil_rev_8_21_14_0_20_43_7]|uniref:dTDP-4-dehydrorhamnose reductase n=1 Tax=Candidatus Magasanikbacteria bacterium CG11_big_fil_rev_8_21_14_0_20_43_7 TaxID=1974654 RepID=A0A2H0N3G7_9BACT|nr:MAG: dTDP-4-dehydrorhamnose reductase [Candidatus Magasanikbacteria bacterium CG11_big_fil_rev_8_21_14_0_20_43_7]